MCPTPDSTSADLQQTIADLQRRLAEARAERDESEAQKGALAEVLGVINASPGDLGLVFDTILEKAHRLFDADFGALMTYDGERFRCAAARSPAGSPRYAELMGEVRLRADGPFDRLLRGERLVHDADLSEVAAQVTHGRLRVVEALVEIGIRTQLIVPLRKDDRFLGVITANRQEVRPFSEKQIALLEDFAAQAVIAMENARLLTETREALEQQTATAEVLQVINSSPGDLTPVFEAMLEKAMRLCEAAFGALLIREGNHFQTVALHGVPPALREFLFGTPREPGKHTAVGRMLEGEDLVHFDMTKEQTYLSGDPRYRAFVELGGTRTFVAVALRKDGNLVGVIGAYRQEVRPFSDKQIALLQNFAAQAVIAMENARLITETREALEQQTATAEVLQVINSAPGNLTPVFDAILEKAMWLCQAACGGLSIYDGMSMRIAAGRGYSSKAWEAFREYVPPVGAMSYDIVQGASVVHVADVSDSEAYRSGVSSVVTHVDMTGIKTGLWIALRKDNNLLGMLNLFRAEIRPFTEKQISLLQNFGAQAVIAIENARLITETREALEQQTATAEVLQVINSSPGDLAPVFDAMLEKAMQRCEAQFGILWTVNDDQIIAAAMRGATPEYADFLRNGPHRPGPSSALARLRRGESYIHGEVLDSEGYRTGEPLALALVELGGGRVQLGVPLQMDSALIGIFIIYRTESRLFTDKQIALLQNFAAQAVIAMENARLLGELQARTRDLEESLEYQTATSDVLNVISRSTSDMQPVLDTVVETAARLCSADLAMIAIREGEVYRPVSSSFSASEPEYWAIVRERTIVPGRDSIAGRAALEGRVVQIADIRADPDFALPETVAARIRLSDKTSRLHAGRRTGLGVPLLREGAVLGTINLWRKRVEPYTERQIELVRTFADQAVIAMENARLLGELHQRTDQVAELNRGLEARVAEQVEELGRIGRLKRFLAPQLAELIVSHGDEKILESHRREIVVVFCDLRGYTAFTETAEPEEVLDFLREYHGALGPLVSQFEGTLDQFSGDGIMVFFNDPVPIPDPAERAVKMAVAMREAAGQLIAAWRERGRDLGFGAGIAQGYATLGQIGFSERSGYTAIGTVCNVAARLCAEAKDGQILLSQRVNVALKGRVATEQVGALALKGLTQPVVAYNVPLAGSPAAFRVIEGGAPSA